MFSSGAGAVGNKSIGTGAVGGMLIGTIIGVFAIPVLFIIFQTLQEKISGPAKNGYDDDEDEEETVKEQKKIEGAEEQKLIAPPLA